MINELMTLRKDYSPWIEIFSSIQPLGNLFLFEKHCLDLVLVAACWLFLWCNAISVYEHSHCALYIYM